MDLPSGRRLHSIATNFDGTRIRQAALSPDPERLAIDSSGGGNPDPNLSLWDAVNSKELWHLAIGRGQLSTLRFSPTGQQLLGISRGHGIHRWDAITGKEAQGFLDPNVGVHDLAFSPDRKLLASGGPEIRIWDYAGGNLLRTLGNGRERIDAISLTFTPAGSTLICGQNSRIVIWDWMKNQQLMVFGEQVRGAVWATVLTADGRSLLTGDREGQVRLWELATRKERACFRGHTIDASVVEVALAPDGLSAASVGIEGAIFVWDLTGQAPEGRLVHAELSDQQRIGLWEILADDDAALANKAIWKLVAGGDDAVAFLVQRLRPVPLDIDTHIERLLTTLVRGEGATRETAMSDLDRLGPLAAAALRSRLEKVSPGETRDRIDYLLRKADRTIPSGEYLRTLTALEVLEKINSPAGRKLLTELAGGHADAPVTREAKNSIGRTGP